MLNEFGSYADAIDSTKNDLARKNVVPERTNYCGNVPEIGPRPANLAVPAATWNCNPYLGNFYNYYGNNSYDLSDVHQYDNQKCVNQFSARNYNQHPIQSASVLQCCDPRCQLFSDHSKYPFSNTLANKYNNQRNKRPTPKSETKPPEPKYTTFPYPTPAQNDLNKYNGQQQNYVYQNPMKSSKHVLLPESSSFGDYYTDIGKPSYWNKQNLWNRSVSGSYYPPPFEPDKVQKMAAPAMHEQSNVTSVNQRGILFNRLLERNRYEAGYMPNYHYGRPPLPQPAKNPAYYQGYPDREMYADCDNTRIPLQNNSYQNLPLYNVHYVDPATQCKDAKQTKAEEKNRILDKNPNLDVREFLSTWEDEEDDKAPEPPETPVIVLDCTSLEGDALAKVKEKLGDNITDCPIENGTSSIEFNSHPGNATVLKVVDDQIVSPHTSVIQESVVDSYAKKDKTEERAEKVADSSHVDGYNMWYGHPKKKDDLSYDLVEMTERLVNTVDKLFSEDKQEKETFYEPHKEPEKNEDQWNINFNYKRNKIEKPPVGIPEPRYKAIVKDDPPYKPYPEFDKEPEKNVSCSFNLQKSNNDLKFSVNYSKQTECYSSKVQDYSVKYKNCDVRDKYKPARVEDYSYKNYYNSYYYNNPSCEYMQMENVKECTYDVENIDNDNASDITLVKADLEKSLKEITHQFSYQKKIETCEKQLPRSVDDPKNDKSENLPTSVIQKTSSHNAEKIYDETDDPLNENSLLSMPSLSPPRCATPRNNAVGLTLNDVYENDVLFDTSNKSENEDKAPENRFSFANLVKNADTRDSVVYPLNLALAKEAKEAQPSVVKLTSDAQANDGADSTESDPIFKVDDGYYSVEMHFDKESRNECETVDDTNQRNTGDDNAKKPVYKTCIVSPEKFHRPQLPNGLPRTDDQQTVRVPNGLARGTGDKSIQQFDGLPPTNEQLFLPHALNGLPRLTDDKFMQQSNGLSRTSEQRSLHLPNGLPRLTDDKYTQQLDGLPRLNDQRSIPCFPAVQPRTDDQRSSVHLSNELSRFKDEQHLRQPNGLPNKSDNQHALPHTQRSHSLNKFPSLTNDQHSTSQPQPPNGLPCVSDNQHSPVALARTADDERSHVPNGLPCLSDDQRHSINGLPGSDNHYSTLYHSSNGTPRVSDDQRTALQYQLNGLPRFDQQPASLSRQPNGLSRSPDRKCPSNGLPHLLDDQYRQSNHLPYVSNEQRVSNGLDDQSSKLRTSDELPRVSNDHFALSEQPKSNGLPHISDDIHSPSNELHHVIDDQRKSNGLPQLTDSADNEPQVSSTEESSRLVLNLTKESVSCDVPSDIESRDKIDDFSNKMNNSSTDDEKLLKSSKFKKYKKHKKMKHRKSENREADSVIKENGNVTRFQPVLFVNRTSDDNQQVSECVTKVDNAPSLPILIPEDTENLDDDCSKKRKFAAGFVKDADLPVKKRKQTVPMEETFRDERTVENTPLDSAQTNDKYSLNGKYPSPVHSSEQITTITPTHCSTVDDEYVHRRKKNKKKHKKDRFRVKSKKLKKDRTTCDPTKSPDRTTLVDEINDACKFSYSGSQETPEEREHATENHDLTYDSACRSVETVANGEQIEIGQNSSTPASPVSNDVNLNETINTEKLKDEHETFKSREYNRSNDKHALSDGENYSSTSYKKLKRYQYDVLSDDETRKIFSQRTKFDRDSVDFENSIVSFSNFKRKILQEKNDLEKTPEREKNSQMEPYSPKEDSGYNEPESHANEESNSPIDPFSPQFTLHRKKLSPLKDSPIYDPIPSPKSSENDPPSAHIDPCPSPAVAPCTLVSLAVSPKQNENDTSPVVEQGPNNEPVEEQGSPGKNERVPSEVNVAVPEISPNSPVEESEPDPNPVDRIPEEPQNVEPSSPHELINVEPSSPDRVENVPRTDTSSGDLEDEVTSPESPMNLMWSKEPLPHELPELEQSIWSGPNSLTHSVDETPSNSWSPGPVVGEVETADDAPWSSSVDHEEALAVEEPEKSIWSNVNSPEPSDDENGAVSPVQFIDFDHETIIASSSNQLWSPANSPFCYESPERRFFSPERRDDVTKCKSLSPERQFDSPRRRSLPSERRFDSPKRRFISPERRDDATKRKSLSPERQFDSPRRRFDSPKRRSISPERRDDSTKCKSLSPERQFHSSRRLSFSERRLDSPKRRFISPERRDDSTKCKSLSPERQFHSSKRLSFSERRSISPERRSISPERRSISPERRSLSPDRRSLSPERRFDSPERRSGSPEHRTDSADSDDENDDSKSTSSKSSWSKQNSVETDDEAKKSDSDSDSDDDEPTPKNAITKDDSANDSSSECDETKIDELLNIPSIAPTPHCDLNKDDEEVAKYDRSDLPKSTKMSDISSKAPSPNCVLHDDVLTAPSSFCVLNDNLARVGESPKTIYFSDQCSISSVAPSPNCDIIDGVLLDDTDKGDEFEEEFVPRSPEPTVACEVPSLRTLAATILSQMSFNSVSTFYNRNRLEVWVTPERTEIVIHSEDQPDQTDLVIGNDNHVMITDAYDDEDVNIASNFDKIKEISFDYALGADSVNVEKTEEDVQCQCLIISSEESIVCLRCSLNSSIIVNQDLDLETDYRDKPDEIIYEPGITPIDAPDSLYVSNCIEDSCIDQRINITPEHLHEAATEEDRIADDEVENITNLIPQPEQPSQIKVQLPWHKIFNLGQEDQKSFELGPAKIQVRVTPDDASLWKLVNSENQRVSPVVKVRRLVVQRATDVEKRTLPETDEKPATDSSTAPSPNEVISRLPKMVIKKTSCKEYKSFLQANIMQPVVKLYKNKTLDALAMKMRHQNNFTINLNELERVITREPEVDSSTCHDHPFQEVNQRISPIPQENIKKEGIHSVDPVAPRDTKSKRVLAPKPEYHHCLLCHRSYTSEESYHLHLKSRFHRHLELTQRKTIHAMYRHFTGHVCPRLRPLSAKERKKMKWKPRSANVNHFYHQKTPLQIALHKSVFEIEPKYENGCS